MNKHTAGGKRAVLIFMTMESHMSLEARGKSQN